jgi:GalNAc-alpha-(1->4)-GalNAc-alpha-(1->3)-diNAcBac-PP-undecaprenol alpha-1,4-N-acetyl-D-galactosaminyltransferase
MNNIVFIIDSLGGGGAQNFLRNFTEYLIKKKNFKISILSIYKLKNNINFSPEINVKFCQQYEDTTNKSIIYKFYHNFKKINFIRNNLKKNNKNIGFSLIGRTNILFLIASININIVKIISERNNPEFQSIGLIWNYLRKILYSKADFVTVNSIPAKKYLENFVNKKVIYLPNIVKSFSVKKNNFESLKTIVSIGRLESQKNYFFLIDTFKIFLNKNSDYKLILIGGGSLKEKIKNYIKFLKLDKNILIYSYSKELESYYINADFLVMTSHYEGTPNVVLESMSVSLPVIVSDSFASSISFFSEIDALVYKADDNYDLLNKMDKLANSRSFREQIAIKSEIYMKQYKKDSLMLLDNFLNNFNDI